MMVKNKIVVEILLVEDNPADVRLTIEALKEAKISNTLNVAGDGIEAMCFLRKEGKYADAVRPGLILLDLNLPKKGGLEVLSEIKGDDSLRDIPIVVLTTSSAEKDIVEAYDRDVNAFITKPVDLNDFVNVLTEMEEIWISNVRLRPDRDEDL